MIRTDPRANELLSFSSDNEWARRSASWWPPSSITPRTSRFGSKPRPETGLPCALTLGGTLASALRSWASPEWLSPVGARLLAHQPGTLRLRVGQATDVGASSPICLCGSGRAAVRLSCRPPPTLRGKCFSPGKASRQPCCPDVVVFAQGADSSLRPRPHRTYPPSISLGAYNWARTGERLTPVTTQRGLVSPWIRTQSNTSKTPLPKRTRTCDPGVPHSRGTAVSARWHPYTYTYGYPTLYPLFPFFFFFFPSLS